MKIKKLLPPFLKRNLKNILKNSGYDLVPFNYIGENTLLGLGKLPVKTVIDVGANEGQFARKISGFFPDARIYSFEPLPVPFEKLANYADSNPNIRPFNLALGSKEEELKINNHIGHSPSSSFLRTTVTCKKIFPVTEQQTETIVQVTTLDAWEISLDSPLDSDILIKLDVQGFEDRVIKGGTQIFAKTTACIVEIGIDQLYNGQGSFEEISNLLFQHKFKYAGNMAQIYADDGHVIYLDAVFVK